MGLTSMTGLTASPIKKIYRLDRTPAVQLRAIAKPAPFVLKPLAGLFNPYPYGCSLLCNHPADNDARELLKRAKDIWAEGKNILLSDEINQIKCELEHLHVNEQHLTARRNDLPEVESVPEELFRRYTETDSRPVTPAPTLASGMTRASGSRRCFTPDPQFTNKVHEKTLLVLDLRRSHSQETLSCFGSSSFLEPPIIRIQHVPTRSTSLEELNDIQRSKNKSPVGLSAPGLSKTPRIRLSKGDADRVHYTNEDIDINNEKQESDDEQNEEDEEFMRRRGKKRRRKVRDSSRSLPPVQNAADPETQVATIGDESHETSARPSLVPVGTSQDIPDTSESSTKQRQMRTSRSLDVDSFLDAEILKHLRRQLTEEIVELEFNMKRKRALQEALKTVSKDKIECDELVNLQKELALPPVNTDMWLRLPRAFSRSSARFELPMDSRTLRTMTPLEYVKRHVCISSPRKILYNCIFNKYREDTDGDRILSGKNLQEALDTVMGKPMVPKQQEYFQGLIEWKDTDFLDFETFCGLCALCERLLAAEYCPQLPDRKLDPCQQIEIADFESLTRKLKGQNANDNLIKILYGIKNS